MGPDGSDLTPQCIIDQSSGKMLALRIPSGPCYAWPLKIAKIPSGPYRAMCGPSQNTSWHLVAPETDVWNIASDIASAEAIRHIQMRYRIWTWPDAVIASGQMRYRIWTRFLETVYIHPTWKTYNVMYVLYIRYNRRFGFHYSNGSH